VTNLQVLVIEPKVLVLIILKCSVLDNNTDYIRLQPLMSVTTEKAECSRKDFKLLLANPKSTYSGSNYHVARQIRSLCSTSQIIKVLYANLHAALE